MKSSRFLLAAIAPSLSISHIKLYQSIWLATSLAMITYFAARAVTQSINWSFIVVQDVSRYICIHNADVMWPYVPRPPPNVVWKIRPQLTLFTPELNGDHLWSDRQRCMLIAGVNWALDCHNKILKFKRNKCNIFVHTQPPHHLKVSTFWWRSIQLVQSHRVIFPL